MPAKVEIICPKSTYETDYLPFHKGLYEKECSDAPDAFQRRKIMRNTVPKDCFDRCSLQQARKERRRQLFASQFPVSEYGDNISRIGDYIIDKELHCHDKCNSKKCEHPFNVDLHKDPRKKRKCKHIKPLNVANRSKAQAVRYF